MKNRSEFIMTEKTEETEEEIWKRFLRKQWKMVLIVAGVIAGAAIGALFVFLWVKDTTVAATPALATLGNWTMGYGMTFFLNILLWEFLIIGLPLIAAVLVILILWWKKLPEEEREEYKGDPNKKKSKKRRNAGGGGGGLSFLVFIVWMIIVFVEGRWNTAFSAWTLDYLIYSSLWAWGWVLLICGIPMAIVAIWWLRRELK